MGTNFYASPKQGNFPDGNYTIENIEGCACVHIAKTSGGWKPLFAEQPFISSVKDLTKFLKDSESSIVDEYGNSYSIDEFKKRVIDWNGGTDKKKPISHLEYQNGAYKDHYFVDEQGYEFCNREFS